MSRRLTIGLHDGESIVMQADGPEEAVAFDGLAERMCLPPETAGAESCDAMPDGRYTIRSLSTTETAHDAEPGFAIQGG